MRVCCRRFVRRIDLWQGSGLPELHLPAYRSGNLIRPAVPPEICFKPESRTFTKTTAERYRTPGSVLGHLEHARECARRLHSSCLLENDDPLVENDPEAQGLSLSFTSANNLDTRTSDNCFQCPDSYPLLVLSRMFVVNIPICLQHQVHVAITKAYYSPQNALLVNYILVPSTFYTNLNISTSYTCIPKR